MADFASDATLFVGQAAKLVAAQMKQPAIVQAIFNLGLGSERLLKEVLWRLNPLYVLEEPDFRNSVAVFYSSSLVVTSTKDVEKNPNRSVLSFRAALARACVCSNSSAEHKALLFTIASYRDIVAHHNLSLLDYERALLLLQRDMYPLARSFSTELGIPLGKMLSNQNVKLADLSARLEQDVEKATSALLEAHRARWVSLRGNSGYVDDKQDVTAQVLKTPFKAEVKCPACGNPAVLYGAPQYEFQSSLQAEVLVGVNATKMKCQYCKLEIADYKTLDYLGIGNVFATGAPSVVEQKDA